MKKIKIIIADDHELFRNGLKELLKKYNDIDIVDCVGDGGWCVCGVQRVV